MACPSLCCKQINSIEINGGSSVGAFGERFEDSSGNFFDGEGPPPPGVNVFSITCEGIIPGYPDDSVWVRYFLVFSIL
jgi:hypothetical protein